MESGFPCKCSHLTCKGEPSKVDVGLVSQSFFKLRTTLSLMVPLLYQHGLFYREVSLQDSHYSFVNVTDRDWPAFKTFCTTIHRYPILSTRYSVMCKVYTGYCGTSEIEHGLCACTVDNPLAKAWG